MGINFSHNTARRKSLHFSMERDGTNKTIKQQQRQRQSRKMQRRRQQEEKKEEEEDEDT